MGVNFNNKTWQIALVGALLSAVQDPAFRDLIPPQYWPWITLVVIVAKRMFFPTPCGSPPGPDGPPDVKVS